MAIFGGGFFASNVMRLLDLRNRTYSEAAGPAALTARSYVQSQFLYISSLRQFLLFGGYSVAGQRLNDLWLFNPVSKTWTPVAHQNPPSSRYYGQMAYDPVQNVVYLTGGNGGDGRVSILPISTWTWEHLPLPPGQVLVDYPGLRRVGVAIFDPDSGFCTTAGVLEAGTWLDSIKTWCFKHQVVPNTMPPQPPVPDVAHFVPALTGDLTVAWQTSPSADTVRYELQRSQDNGITWIDQISIMAASNLLYAYTYTGVLPSRVRVRALDASNNASPFVEIPVQ